MDPDGREDEDIVRSWLYDAVAFIDKNATHEYEQLVASKLKEMMNNGKIQLDDVTIRHEKENISSDETTMGFFDFFLSTATGQPRKIIVLDIKNALKYGYAEFIDTVAHEGWHAVQFDKGSIQIDSNNKATYYPSLEAIEIDASEIGNNMRDKYIMQEMQR